MSHRPFRIGAPYKNTRSVAIIMLIIITLASNGDTSADRFGGGRNRGQSIITKKISLAEGIFKEVIFYWLLSIEPSEDANTP